MNEGCCKSTVGQAADGIGVSVYFGALNIALGLGEGLTGLGLSLFSARKAR